MRRRKVKEAELTAKTLEQVWTDLGKDDAAVGQAALWTLAFGPKQAIPFLKDRLQPAVEADPKRIHQLLADLDSNRFVVREAAAKELEQQEQQAEALLQEAFGGKPSAEVRKRLEAILPLRRQARSPDSLRRLRAIQALEYVGSGEARDILKSLARGAPAAWETQEAKAALERLAKQPKH